MTNLSLDGRVAIVTGAGSGIGAAVAKGLAELGTNVVVNDLSTDTRGDRMREDSAATVARIICEGGGVAIPDRSSVADPSQVAEMIDSTINRFGRLDMLLNFAGISRSLPLAECDIADWDAVIEVHLAGHLNCIEAALSVMEPSGFGRIVNITSGAGLIRASAGNAAYGTAKRAIAALTWKLASRLPAGVTVNAISPVASTRMTEAARLERAQKQTTGALDLKGLSSPHSLVPLVAYICSDHGEWLNGKAFFTNGRQISTIEESHLTEVIEVLPQWSIGETAQTLAEDLLIPAALENHHGGDSIPPLGVRTHDDIDIGRTPATAARLHGGVCILVENQEHEESELKQSLVTEGWSVHRVQDPWVVSAKLHKEPDVFKEATTMLRQMSSVVGTPDAIVISSLGSFGRAEDEVGRGYPAKQVLIRALRFHAAYTRASLMLSLPLKGTAVLNVASAGSSSVPLESVLGQALAQLTRVVQSGVEPQVLRVYCAALNKEIAMEGTRELAELATFLWRQDKAGVLTGRPFVVGEGWVGMQSHPTIGFTASTEHAGWSFEDLERVLNRTMSEDPVIFATGRTREP
jgi:NAD(P)-dependent dehydrogenase (short-subunit alcohol dehydrogenase family)